MIFNPMESTIMAITRLLQWRQVAAASISFRPFRPFEPRKQSLSPVSTCLNFHHNGTSYTRVKKYLTITS
jgi:hypothetical protein